MIRAYPIDSTGKKIGGIRIFSDSEWERLIVIPNLRWVEIKEETPVKNINVKKIKKTK